MDLLSLPPEILANIFSYIQWNELVNIKLCARKFNFIVKRYFKSMQKPKIIEIMFCNDYTHVDYIDRIVVLYKILKSNTNSSENNDESRSMRAFCLPSSKLDELHNFLQKVDLTSLNLVDISLDNHTEIIRIFGEYFHNPNRINSIYVTSTNCEKDLDNTLSFLENIQNVEHLELNLCFSNLNVPKDFIIPVRNSLNSIVIHEKANTVFVNSRMIEYIVENNPNLEEYNFFLNNFENYKMIIETVVRRKLSKRDNRCFHKSICLRFGISSYETFFELSNYDYSGNLPYNHSRISNLLFDNSIEVTFYNGYLECPVCGEFDSIEICGRTFFFEFN
uniref:F-box domain-containing protein n=1 Tax=Strongyloides venezuelensis TaxID=75913 RepID=A0A0K0EWD9_STRVS